MKTKKSQQLKLSALLLLFALALFACNRNRLKTDEKALTKQILTEEEQLAHEQSLREEREKLLMDSIAKLPKGFQFREERGIDPQQPPVVIDIAGSLGNKKEFKLSELVKEIKYIPLDDIPEATYSESGGYSITMADNNILVKCLYGLFLFNKDGSFKEVVCRNEGGRIETLRKNQTQSGAAENATGFLKGVFLGEVWTIDNQLFYRHVDNQSKKQFLMRFDMASSPNSIPLQSTSEEYQIVGKGEILTSLGVGQGKRFNEYIPTGKESFVGINSKIKSSKNGKLMVSFLNKGDTLSSFSDFETINKYSHTLMRGNFPQISYQYGRTLTFLNAFNDTVFRVVPPNRLLPAYILNMGDYKIETQEGFTPGQDISSKLYVSEFIETRTHIFLKIIQNYDCIENRKNKSVDIFHAIYEKAKGRLSFLPLNSKGYYGIVNGNEDFYRPQGIVNDIDGGFLFWPQKVSPNGEVYEMILGEKLKEHIQSETFINSNAPQNKKDKLIHLTKTIRPNQLVLIVYK